MARRPLPWLAALAVIAALSVGGWKWWLWWESHRPREFAYQPEQQVEVGVVAPPEAPMGVEDKDVPPLPLRITFSLPAAPIAMVGKPVADVAFLSPAVKGTWSWENNRQLCFLPESRWWPAGQDFKVSLRPEALATGMKYSSTELAFSTPPLKLLVSSFAFHTEPQDPTIQLVWGEVRTNYPLALESLNASRMEVLGGAPLFARSPEGKPVAKFEQGSNSRQFWVRSPRLTIPEAEDFVRLTIPSGIKATSGGKGSAAEVSAKTRVPDKFSGLVIESAESTIIRTEDGVPQQFVFVTTNLDIENKELAARLKMWWRSHSRSSPSNEELLREDFAPGSPVVITPVESEAPFSNRHAFRFTEPRPGALHLLVKAGVKAPGGFETNRFVRLTTNVPAFPKEIRLLGEGNVLALGGSRKLLAEARGVDFVQVTLSRVPVSQLQHLVSFNMSGRFAEPELNYPFGPQNMVQSWSTVLPVQRANDWEAIQLECSLAGAPPMLTPDQLPGGQGIFFVSVMPVKSENKAKPVDNVLSRVSPPNSEEEGEDVRPGHISSWDSRHWYNNEEFPVAEGWQRAQGSGAERFVMVTDLGLMVKVNADATREVFVMSLGAGLPVENVRIIALAKNGTTLAETTTDAEGRASLATLEGLTGERVPVAVVAQNDQDTTFLPLRERQLPAMDYSRFDVDGVFASKQKTVEAYLFTERGVYRPGDPIHVGAIVRRRDWQPVIEGLPVVLNLKDSKGRRVGQHRTRLPYDGFVTTDFTLSEAAALGVHQIEMSVEDGNGNARFRIGRHPVRVEEFQPDRMKVSTKLDPAPPQGWMKLQPVEAVAEVRSLFDEPAAKRRITTRVELSPADFRFAEWDGYQFHDRSREKSGSVAGRTLELGETETDESGVARVEIPLTGLKDASFRMAVLTEAFELEGGRSVRSNARCLVSPWNEVVGWKADGGLDFLGKDAVRAVRLVAVGPDVKSVALPALRKRLVEIRRVSVLTKLKNGNHAYVSTERESVVAEEDITLPEGGMEIVLDTSRASSFRLEIVNVENAVLCAVPYRVAGKGEDADIAREAELELVLSRPEAQPGEEIEVHLSAPYAGHGLVTLEREKVISAHWFKTDSKTATLKIPIPADAEGTVYVNAAFVRSPSSPEILHAPLSYAAAPLIVAPDRRTLQLTLVAPKEVRPGTEVKFTCSSNQPAKAVVYAVDEGIHQITAYRLPKPLDFFNRKQALEVRTLQWLDLLLPDYQFLKQSPAFGGDGDSALNLHINPFKRRREPPVVFWSGPIDVGPEAKELTWLVPDYFNGNLKVMAVAVQASGVGVMETATLAKAPIILVPNVPNFVAPGDEFEATVAVTNNAGKEGESPIAIAATPAPGLQIISEPVVNLVLATGKEGVARYRLKALDSLGEATLAFAADGAGENAQRATSMSVRPGSHHRTKVVTGWFRTADHEQALTRDLYQAFAKRETTASVLPMGMARGLESYVSQYPHGCSEQITSAAMVKLLASNEADFGLDPAVASEHIRVAISRLAGRQNPNGGFSYWESGPPREFEFHSLYVYHFLLEAKLLGHVVPQSMLDGAANYAAATARANLANLGQAELQAYAIYLRARDGRNPSPQLLNLRDSLTKQFGGKWEGGSTAAWMAATYALLKQEKEANKLMKTCLEARAKGNWVNPGWGAYHSNADVEGLKIFYVRCRHFPGQAKEFGITDLEPILKPLRDESFSTLGASFVTLALKAYGDVAGKSGLELTLEARDKANVWSKLAGPATGIVKSPLTESMAAVRFSRQQKGDGDIGAFYQLVEQGYDRGRPPGPMTSGLAVAREWKPVGGKPTVRPGDAIEVVVRVRNLANRSLADLAVIDLLPGGFEVVAGALKSGAGTVPGTEFAEVREDRNLFYLSLPPNGEWSATYRVKAVCSGTFLVPGVMAEDMYDRGRHGLSAPTEQVILPAP